MQSKSKFTLLSASALMLVLSGGAYAAGQSGYTDPAQQQQSGAMQGQQPQAQVTESDISQKYAASGLQNLEVQDSQGQQLGSIQELLVDDQGQVSHVVVSEGGGVLGLGGGGQQYVVPWERVRIDEQQQAAVIDIGQDQMSSEFSAFEELPPTKLDQEQGQQMQQEEQQQPELQQQPEGGGFEQEQGIQ